MDFRLKGVASHDDGSVYRIHYDCCWPFQIIQYIRIQINGLRTRGESPMLGQEA